MGISTLAANFTAQVRWQAANNLVGSVYNPVTNSGGIQKSYDFGTKLANNASGGGDQFYSFQQAIAGGGSATLDLTALTNILQQSSMGPVRIKGVMLRLLATTDDSTIAAPAASGVTVSNVLPTLPNPLFFGSGGSGLLVNLTCSAGVVTAVAINTAGSGYPKSSFFLFAPQQVGGSGCVCVATTNASGVPTAVALAATGSGGTGYTTNTAIPIAEVGKVPLNASSCLMCFDTSAAGMIAVSSTSKNIQILNNDPTNTATVELTFLGASS